MPAEASPSKSAKRSNRWPRTTLRNYFVAIILAATVPLALLISLQIVGDGQRQLQVLMSNLRSGAKAVAVGVDREIVASVDALRVLGQSDMLQRSDIAAFERRLGGRGPLRPSWDRLALLGPDGVVRIDIDAPGASPGTAPLPAERAALIRAWQSKPAGGSQAWSVSAADPAAQTTWVGVFAAAPDGKRYLLAARIRQSVWQSLLQGAAPEGGGFVTLFDAERRVLARTLAPERFIGARLPPDAVATIDSAASGARRAALLGGGETYAAWQMLPHGGWGVAVGMSAAPFDAAQRSAMLLAFGVAAACLLLAVGSAMVVARRVTRPLRQLLEQPTPGSHSLIDSIEVAEIAQLRDAFRQLELARSEATGELATKAEEFQTLFHTSPSGLAFARDADVRCVLSNAAMDRIAPGLVQASVEAEVEFFSAGKRMTRDELPLARAARFGEPVQETEIEMRAAGQPPRFVLASAVPLSQGDRTLRGAIVSATDITERRVAEQERADAMGREQIARREAETANRMKDDLLSMLGHELRNPLNAIMTSVEVLRRAEPHSPLANSARAVVDRQTRKLASMVDELLDVGQIMSDTVRLLKQPIELAEVVQAAVAVARPAADERQQRLAIGTLMPARVQADSRRMAQVLGHLLENATKYTQPGGEIEVSLSAVEGEAVLRVQDDGPGIDPGFVAHMFDPFVQGQPGLARSGGGMGIGLTLVKRLVEGHGGTVTSTTSADGTSFEVRLPLLSRPDSTGASPCSVGVIDDNPDALTSMRSMLELAGHRVHTAADGVDGLNMLLTESPDAAVVDIGLPGIDGYEVARRSRAGGFRGRLIAMSGYGQQRDRQRSLDEGFMEHLVKPVFPDRLIPLLQGVGEDG